MQAKPITAALANGSRRSAATGKVGIANALLELSKVRHLLFNAEVGTV
jgi:hypothetical protein